MLEVGKKYTFQDNPTVYTCEFITKEGFAVLSLTSPRPNYYPIVEPPSKFSNWKEYKEPQTIIGYVGVYKRPNGELYFSLYQKPNDNLIDTVKIEYTEKT